MPYYIPKNYDQKAVYITDMDRPYHPGKYQKNNAQSIIFYIDDPQTLVSLLLASVLSENWIKDYSPRIQYLSITTKKNNITQLAGMYLKYDIVNALFLTHEDLQIYHSAGYSKGEFCGTIPSLIELGKCTEIKNFQVNQHKNFNGCKISTLVLNKYNMFPYVNDFNDTFPGLFLKLLQSAAKKHNFTLSYIIADVNETTRYLQKAENPVFEEFIKNKSVDVFVALFARHATNFTELTTLTEIIYFSENYWLVPKTHQLLIDVATKMFEKRVLLLIFLLISTVYTISKIVKKLFNPDNNLEFIWFWGTFTENVYKIKTQSKILLSVIGIFILFAMVFSNLFKSKLSSSLIHPLYINEIKNVKDLADSTYKLACRSSTKIVLQKLSQPLARKIYDKIDSSSVKLLDMDLLKDLVEYRNISVSIDANLWSFLGKKMRTFDVVTKPNFLLETMCSYALRKGHPILNILDEVISRARESGLISKDVNDMYNERIVEEIGVRKLSERRPLGLSDIYIVFYIYLFMTCLSILVFIGELLFDYITKTQDRSC